MRPLPILHGAAWLVVGAFLVLEGSHVLARVAHSGLAVEGPIVSMDAEGKVTRRWERYVLQPNGMAHREIRVAADDGPVGPWFAEGSPEGARLRAAAFATFECRTLKEAYWGEGSGAPSASWFEGMPSSEEERRRASVHAFAASLNRHEQVRRARPDASAVWRAPQLPIRWTFEDGRFVCADYAGPVLAAFGANGWRDAARVAEVEPFPTLLPVERVAESWWDRRRDFESAGPPAPFRSRAFVTESGDVVFLVLGPGDPAGPSAADAPVPPLREPMRVDVRIVRPEAGPVAPLFGRVKERYAPGDVRATVRAGNDVVSVGRDGRTDVLLPGAGSERFVSLLLPAPSGVPRANGFAGSTVSIVGTPEPLVVRVRIRRFRDESAPVVCDVEIRPQTVGQRVAATARVVAALVRPPFLNAAAVAAPPPSSLEDMCTRWWLDPLFAADGGVLWMAISLAVALLCGTWVARSAAVRVPERRRVLLWTIAGALLGPMGVAWYWVVVRRAAVQPCSGCGRRRAVDVADCPGCGVEWPLPAARGTEVIA